MHLPCHHLTLCLGSELCSVCFGLLISSRSWVLGGRGTCVLTSRGCIACDRCSFMRSEVRLACLSYRVVRLDVGDAVCRDRIGGWPVRIAVSLYPVLPCLLMLTCIEALVFVYFLTSLHSRE